MESHFWHCMGLISSEGQVKTKLLVRDSYQWLEEDALQFLTQKDEDDKQVDSLVYILRGNPGRSCTNSDR